MIHLSCYSERSEESLINLIGQTTIRLESCFASLNMTDDRVRFFSPKEGRSPLGAGASAKAAVGPLS